MFNVYNKIIYDNVYIYIDIILESIFTLGSKYYINVSLLQCSNLTLGNFPKDYLTNISIHCRFTYNRKRPSYLAIRNG